MSYITYGSPKHQLEIEGGNEFSMLLIFKVNSKSSLVQLSLPLSISHLFPMRMPSSCWEKKKNPKTQANSALWISS